MSYETNSDAFRVPHQCFNSYVKPASHSKFRTCIRYRLSDWNLLIVALPRWSLVKSLLSSWAAPGVKITAYLACCFWRRRGFCGGRRVRAGTAVWLRATFKLEHPSCNFWQIGKLCNFLTGAWPRWSYQNASASRGVHSLRSDKRGRTVI